MSALDLAQAKADENIVLAQSNLLAMNKNTAQLEENLLPSAMDLNLVAAEQTQVAKDIEEETKSRRNKLYCIIGLVVLAILAIIALVLALKFK